jgi:hypothetical protein
MRRVLIVTFVAAIALLGCGGGASTPNSSGSSSTTIDVSTLADNLLKAETVADGTTKALNAQAAASPRDLNVLKLALAGEAAAYTKLLSFIDQTHFPASMEQDVRALIAATSKLTDALDLGSHATSFDTYNSALTRIDAAGVDFNAATNVLYHDLTSTSRP